MTKYIAIVDYKANTRKGFEHVELAAQNLLDAMNEAETLFDEEIYLVDIAEKVGKTEKVDGHKETKFTEILRNRGNGWHRCDSMHGESPATWKMIQTKYGPVYAIENINF